MFHVRVLLVAAFALLAGLPSAFADPFADARVAALIERLGSDDFHEREATTEELGMLGEPAAPLLRDGVRSPSPEVSRRAAIALTRIERRLDNEKSLAPTMVEIDAIDRTLNDVLKELSGQSKYSVLLGSNPELGKHSISVKTGRVPFWTAVLRICGAAELEIQSVDASFAPGARPEPRKEVRPGTIALQPRGLTKRPAFVAGTVLVEAFDAPPSKFDGPSVLLQVWPEPKLNWTSAKGASLGTAVDDSGQVLLRAPTVDQDPPPTDVREIKNIRLTARENNPWRSNVTSLQALLRFKPGTRPSARLTELTGSVQGVVRAPAETLVSISDLKSGESCEVTHRGVKLRASIRQTAEGDWTAEVELAYDESAIQYQDGDLPGSSLMGIRVADDFGKPFRLKNESFTDYRHDGSRCTRRATLTLEAREGRKSPPSTVSFWGIGNKSIEVPFAFKDVPLTAAK